MKIMIRSDVRSNASIGFYEQLNFNEYHELTYRFYKMFMPKIKKYEDRYSADLLTMYSVWEFIESQTIADWYGSILVSEYRNKRNLWNSHHGIVSTLVIKGGDRVSGTMAKESIVSTTWPKSCFIINEIAEFMPDRMIPGASIPPNDRLIFEPWTTWL